MFWSSTQSLNSSSCEVDSLKSTAKSHDVEGISAIGDLLKSNNSKKFAVSQQPAEDSENRREVSVGAALCRQT